MGFADASTPATGATPAAAAIERRVLGALVWHPHLAAETLARLHVDCFTGADRRALFGLLRRLAREGRHGDLLTVTDLVHAGRCEPRVGLAEWAEVSADGYSACGLAQHVEHLRGQADLRALRVACDRLAAQVREPGERTAAELVAEVQRAVLALGTGEDTGGGLVAVGAEVDAYLDAQDARLDTPGALLGRPTGLPQLDAALCGLVPGDLIVVAGRPSMGKTSLALNMAEHIARHAPEAGRVLVFSLEMGRRQLLNRMVCSLGRLDAGKLRRAEALTDAEHDRRAAVTAWLRTAPVWIDETPGLDIGTLRARVMQARARGPIGVVVVDYLQLMDRQPARGETDAAALGRISKGLKQLARQVNAPVVLLSQLNRGVEGRENKRPRMADLRESGAIEQDADVILFVYREEVYDEATVEKGVAEIIVGKQRNGPRGVVRVGFQGEYTRFVAAVPRPAAGPVARRKTDLGGASSDPWPTDGG